MNEEMVWVSRSSIAWEIFIACAQAETASMLFMFFLFLMSCINLAWIFRSIVFDAKPKRTLLFFNSFTFVL